MKISYNVPVPEKQRNRGEVRRAIEDFLVSDKANLKFECDCTAEATRVYSSARTAITCGCLFAKAMKRGNDIYVVRKEGK